MVEGVLNTALKLLFFIQSLKVLICTDSLMHYFRYGDKVTKSFFGRLITIAWTIFGVALIGLVISFLCEAVVHSAQYTNRSIIAKKVRKEHCTKNEAFH